MLHFTCTSVVTSYKSNMFASQTCLDSGVRTGPYTCNQLNGNYAVMEKALHLHNVNNEVLVK